LITVFSFGCHTARSLESRNINKPAITTMMNSLARLCAAAAAVATTAQQQQQQQQD
jgi:hypothetical protein